jgi:uncharacterized protein YjgD (DUF1641 family)
MAHPITFKPAPVDPRKELMERVANAPREHADALLTAWELLQTAHDQGILDLAKGLIGGKDIITKKIAESANLPESVSAIRNGMALARVLASFDPDMLQRMAKALDEAAHEKLVAENEAAKHGSASVGYRNEEKSKAPSLWSLLKSATSKDARRGMAFGLTVVSALGRAARGSDAE